MSFVGFEKMLIYTLFEKGESTFVKMLTFLDSLKEIIYGLHYLMNILNMLIKNLIVFVCFKSSGYTAYNGNGKIPKFYQEYTEIQRINN